MAELPDNLKTLEVEDDSSIFDGLELKLHGLAWEQFKPLGRAGIREIAAGCLDLSRVARAIRRAADDAELDLNRTTVRQIAAEILAPYLRDVRNSDGQIILERLAIADAQRSVAEWGASEGGLVVSTATALLEKKFRPRTPLMVAAESAIFHLASINQLHAWRGVGKTNFMQGLSKAFATGGDFLLWKAPRPFRVLYIEGELPGEELQQRTRDLIGNCDNFLVITPEDQPDSVIPSIATAEGRSLIEDAITIHGVEVVVLDSVSTLANIATNDEEQWLEILGWFKYLRNKYGIALFYLHHDGKAGLQRGSSKSEDILDKSIQLLWEDGYTGNDGLRCIMKFDKARQPVRVGAHLKVELTTDADGSLCWTCSEIGPKEKEAPTWLAQAIEMRNSGMSMQSIASALGVSKNKVWRNLNRKRTAEEDTLPF
jgi:hypothetical protein